MFCISTYIICLYILVLSPQDVEPPKTYKYYGDNNIDMAFNYNNDYYAIENQPNYPVNQFQNQGRVWTIQILFVFVYYYISINVLSNVSTYNSTYV